MPSPPNPALGPVLATRFQIESELGRGGMGVVYAALERASGRRVALKVIQRRRGAEASFDRERARQRERLLMEARAAAAVRHAHIVDVLDVGHDEDDLFLVMERLEGETLESALRERGRIDPALAMHWLLPINRALAALHRAGVVHRDVKPSNIFLHRGPTGITPKLLDFGLARRDTDARVTSSGEVIGTLAYMAPEHAAGQAVGPAADVWSLGVVMYECVAGRTPYPALDRAALAMQILLGRVQPLLTVCPQLPVRFANAIDGALKRDVLARHRSMDELASALAGTTDSALAVGAPNDAHHFAQAAELPLAADALRGASTAPEAEVLRALAASLPDTVPGAPAQPWRRRVLLSACAIVLLGGALGLAAWRAELPANEPISRPMKPSSVAPRTAPATPVVVVHELLPAEPAQPIEESAAPARQALPKASRKRAAAALPRAQPGKRRARSGVESEWW